ncbi:FAD-binding Berberine family protein, putative [Theobroma cacao]|uniref:FAD-binding Berberine family protein, putative n=1 Tax=Theobroma cacao TaxID=3641 RepID=A0A061G180_THECC|nr:FAD-binding Berberine family protein, putative [Theobroma cacao]
MEEDLFWAIRGSYGIVLAWKLNLVPVPATVTVFSITKTLEQNATELIHRWQYAAHKFPDDIYLIVTITRVNSGQEGKDTIQAVFTVLGGVDNLISLMEKRFPELGVVKQDCIAMCWIQSLLYLSQFPIEHLEILLDRSTAIPYGGKMDEIPETETPFPHRAGNMYKIIYNVRRAEEENLEFQKYINWIRRFYSHMTPNISKSPREAYVNYRDLEIGVNNKSNTSYAQASIWGFKYFKNDFNKLVPAKTLIDFENFFKHEQSIPPLSSL